MERNSDLFNDGMIKNCIENAVSYINDFWVQKKSICYRTQWRLTSLAKYDADN